MKRTGAFIAGAAAGLVIAGGTAGAVSLRSSDANYPGLRIACGMARGQLSCFTVTAKGQPVKNGTGVGITKTNVYVFKHGKAVFYTHR